MNDQVVPKKTVLEFLKFTYWGLPKMFFGGTTLFWMYILPFLIFFSWQSGEKFRLTEPPRFENLLIVQGKAVFRTGRKALVIKLEDGSEFAPNCRVHSLSGGACIYSEKIAAGAEGKPVKAWSHPIVGTLQVELDGTVHEGNRFELLSKEAMDTTSTDFKRLLCILYAFSMLLFMPIFASTEFFEFRG
jgi:hypothetical protein